ncbi:MAG: phytanoyl-CoA dioxygenase family protein [Gemmatimonadota bacterium]|nr:phytanoyl-CoA dioxygenase family protein [Gemmatimonadota bacterium]
MNEIEQAIQEIEIYGFTLLESVLDSDTAASMRQALIRCEQEHGTEHTHRGAARHVANLPVMDRIFHQCIDHPRVLPILEHFLEPSLILGSLNSRIVRPGDGFQDLHSDIPAYMLNMDTPVMMNTVWMLDDFTPEIGGTRVVPGSHKSGLAAPPEGFAVQHEVQPTALAGSVIVFNGQCWHGGGANTGDRNRHALFGHYRKHMLVFQLDPHDGFPPEWWDSLSPRQRQLMRMQNGPGALHAADVHFR